MFTADWALRRVLKFVLKRSVGRYLQNDLDLEQLDVQLGTGAIELRNALLNCDSINERLVRRPRGRAVCGGGACVPRGVGAR
jgi:autophagy-related protein 2